MTGILKRVNRWISLVLSMTMVASSGFFLTPLSAKALGEGSGQITFKTSFESGDMKIMESKLDENRVKNITAVSIGGRLTGDITGRVRSDTLSGSPDFKAQEGKQNLFDYNTESKFLTGQKASSQMPVEVVMQLTGPSIVKAYLVASANDEAGRDLAAWTFSGSSDGENWTPLDSHSGITFSAREEKKIFEISNTDSYSYYKISITENNGADMTQFSELQLADEMQSGAEEEITNLVDLTTLSGSDDFNVNEGKANLFDHNGYTKFLTGAQPSAEAPVSVAFQLQQSAVVNTYKMGAGPDELSRNPKSWSFYGSVDGNSWVSLDTQSGIVFGKEQEIKEFSFSNSISYSYYKLMITENNGAPMTQFSAFQLYCAAESQEPPVEEGASPMKTIPSRGPSSSYNALTSTGWTGWNALEVLGKHTGHEEAYCYNVLYDNLNIPVKRNTNLSYVIFPALYDPDSYDTEYTSQYLAVDLKFTDGSYLSQLSIPDQNGNIISPRAQGESKTLMYMQWNNIYANIGSVAEGKIIDQILIGYDKPDNYNANDSIFLAYFDDITIEEKEPVVYDHLSDYVNILRGTNSSLTYSRGQNAPAVTTPHGFNFYCPVTESNNSQPYYYQLAGNKTKLRHISVEHVASPWIGDWGTWQFMANSSIDIAGVNSGTDINSDARAADFSHDNEVAHAHYYSVTFDEGSAASEVKMEITPTDHSMYARITFPEGSNYRNLIFDSERADGGLTFHDDGTFTAYSDHVYGWNNTYNDLAVNGATRMYVYGVLDQVPDSFKVVNTKQGMVSFGEDVNTVTMKVATSFISPEQAKKNLELEISESDTFNTVYQKAQKTWDDQLGIVEVEGADYEQMVTLYSCMYRMLAYPNLYAENTGTNEDEVWKYSSPYSGSLTSPDVKEGKMYTTNGFWDTYRAAWPAYSLLTPTKAGEMLDGLIQHYKDSGWVSRWVSAGSIHCMLGTNIDAIFGDAMAKGISFDWQTAFEASVKNSAVVTEDLVAGGRVQTATDIFTGYTPSSVHDSFSWGIEDTVNDYNIAKMAQILGKTDEAVYYKNRALFYINYYNQDLGWFMARNEDGSFMFTDASKYDPRNWNIHYCESNGWNMSFSAVQDIQGDDQSLRRERKGNRAAG